MNWLLQIIVWTVILFINGRLTIWLYHLNNQRAEKKFLKAMQVEFPDASKRVFIAVTTSDRDALAKLEKEIRARSE